MTFSRTRSDPTDAFARKLIHCRNQVRIDALCEETERGCAGKLRGDESAGREGNFGVVFLRPLPCTRALFAEVFIDPKIRFVRAEPIVMSTQNQSSASTSNLVWVVEIAGINALSMKTAKVA